MPKEVLGAIGAGLASAAAAMAFLSGTFMALGFAYLAPLPILMAGLAYGPRAATIAAGAGILALGILGSPLMGGIFAVIHGLPAWMIVKLALIHRPGRVGANGQATLVFALPNAPTLVGLQLGFQSVVAGQAYGLAWTCATNGFINY